MIGNFCVILLALDLGVSLEDGSSHFQCGIWSLVPEETEQTLLLIIVLSILTHLGISKQLMEGICLSSTQLGTYSRWKSSGHSLRTLTINEQPIDFWSKRLQLR